MSFIRLYNWYNGFVFGLCTGLMNIDNAIKILILFGKYHKQIKMVTL